MVAVVGGTQAREFVGVLGPVEVAAVDNTAAEGRRVTVHVFCGGVGHDIRAPLKRTAVNGCGEGVVHNEGNAVAVGGAGKFFNVQHRQSRVCDGLAEDRLGVGAEGGIQLLLGAVGVDEGDLDAHALHGDGKQVEGAAVDGGGGDDMVAAAGNIEHGKEVGSLAGAGEHCRSAALQGGDLRRNGITGGIAQTGVKIAVVLQVKEPPHGVGGLIAESSTLNDGNLARFSVFRRITGLDAQGFGM